MSLVSSSVGLVSGLNYQALVTALTAPAQAAITTLQGQDQTTKSQETAVSTLVANLLPLTTSATNMGTASNFNALTVQNSDTSQMTVTTTTGAKAGNYQLQSLRLATAQQSLSAGFANTTQQLVGAGTITIAPGGQLATQTGLDVLNGGAGINRGIIQITDRSGASASVDLSNATTVDDVLSAINNTSGIAVHAGVQGGAIVLTDTSGQSTSNLTVIDKGSAETAESLGIAGSVASSTLSGTTIYQATGAFTLASLNGGSPAQLAASGQPSLKIQLTDSAATTLDVDLTGAATLNDVVKDINNASGNSGKLTASIANGRLSLVDNTGGGGSQPLSVSDENGASVTQELGLNATASGNTLTGNQIVGGIDSVLLRNLNGGTGITQLGQISLTDRTGTTATVNLSGAQSVSDVLNAINGATDGLGHKLKLTASLDAAGTGIQIQDTSGASASNLVIADVGGSTLASQLGIAVNGAQTSIDSGSLHLQYVNLGSSLATYGPGETAVPPGTFSITDSTGQQFSVNVTSSVQTIGDLQQLIATSTSNNVTLQLNSTGDGFQLVDQAGGSRQLAVSDLGGTAAAALKIAGTGTTGGDGKSQIESRAGTQITVAATDTLASLAAKINAAQSGVTATIVNDGSTFSPNRLQLTSSQSGVAGRFTVDDGGLGLGFSTQTQGQNALLKVGSSSSANPFFLTSGTNEFDTAIPDLNITLNTVGSSPAQVNVVSDTSQITNLVQTFVTNYNTAYTTATTDTTYNTASSTAAPLQGDGTVLRLETALSNLVSSVAGPAGNAVTSLAQLGISVNQDGTLALNNTTLSQQISQNPTAVSNFFMDATNGFGTKLKNTINSFTDTTTGEFTTETTALQASSTSIEARITQLNNQLTAQQQSLMTTFTNLETVLGNLRNQQTALESILGLTSSSTSSSSRSSPGTATSISQAGVSSLGATSSSSGA